MGTLVKLAKTFAACIFGGAVVGLPAAGGIALGSGLVALFGLFAGLLGVLVIAIEAVNDCFDPDGPGEEALRLLLRLGAPFVVGIGMSIVLFASVWLFGPI